MKNIKAGIVSIAIFVVMTVLFALLICFYARERRDIAVEKAQYLMEAQVSQLERALSSYIQATDTLRILVVNTQGEIRDFDKIAKELYNDDNAFRSIQLAPDGDVQYVYPLEGNEEAFGDLFSDPDRKTEAEYARDTGETTLAGPFELYQSGLGIVVRQPIYLDEGRKDFWGFSIVVLNVPEIFNSVHLDSLYNLGYHYQLWRIQPDTNEKQIILGAQDSVMTEPIEKSFQVPGSVWTLSVSQIEGWTDYKELAAVIIGAASITLLISILCFAILLINEQKRKMAEISYRDYLTELYNGRKMLNVIDGMCSSEKAFYFMYLDIDKFKSVNDTYGHATGDFLLKTVASRILCCIKNGDYAFRIGGDEFAILLPRKVNIEEFTGMLTQELSREVLFEDGSSYFPKVSVGYANFPENSSNFEEVMRIADARMYDRKNAGK